jgi:hypothetical protein
MLFNSNLYLFLFLPLTVAGYFILVGRLPHKAGTIWLVLASLAFYSLKFSYLYIIVASILFNLFFRLGAFRLREFPQKKELGAGGRHWAKRPAAGLFQIH